MSAPHERSNIDVRRSQLSQLEDPHREAEYNIGLPFSDLSGWIYHDETVFQTFAAFDNGARLRQIRQLSFIFYPHPEPSIAHYFSFHHNRFAHSLIVAKVGETILQNNNASDSDIAHISAAGALHDFATPALGDAAKKIDPTNLHEENYLSYYIGQKQLDFFTRAGLDVNRIKDIIKNRGLLGQVLDIADRITYVTTDLHHIMSKSAVWRIFQDLDTDPETKQMAELVMSDSSFGNIYQDVEIDWKKERLVINNPNRLGHLLKLRALLHKSLYVNPFSLGKDLFIGELLKPLYTPNPTNFPFNITPDDLRDMTDEDVMIILARYYCDNDPQLFQKYYHGEFQWYPKHIMRVPFAENAKRLKQAAMVTPGVIPLGVTTYEGFNPATSLLVTSPHGVIPYAEYDPEIARSIHQINDDTKGCYFYYVRLEEEDLSIQHVLKKLLVC